MRKVLAGEAAPFRNFQLKYHVDDKGIIIFNLPDNATIRDAGQAIYFSASNDKAEELASRLAKARWGQSATLEGNKLIKMPVTEQLAEQQIQQDHPMDLSGFGR
jgi:hypothetical protein